MVGERNKIPEIRNATPLGVLYCIANLNPQIDKFNFWVYTYEPLRHDEKGKNPYWISRDDVLKMDPIIDLMNNLQGSEQLAISSHVRLQNNKRGHLPMMDFETTRSENGLEVVLSRLKHVDISNGWILETGQSYQLYGPDILTNNEWLDFLAKCLLMSIVHTRQNIEQVADPRYIGHSLRRKCSTLRLTTNGDKNFIPKVVAKI